MMITTMMDAMKTTPSVEPISESTCAVGVDDWIMAPAVALWVDGEAGMVIAMAVRMTRTPANIHRAMRKERGSGFILG